jgi:bifunctional non-homologous end joining protein LigD
LAREVERRAPTLATSKWWKEERHGVFLDYNQNAKDRTVASAYSVRPTLDARVSAPLTWHELAICDPGEFTLRSMPKRFAEIGDRHAGIDDQPGSLEALLELSAQHERAGLGDAPWPPHYEKQADEPARVRPSAARKPRAEAPGAEPAPRSSKRRVSKHPLIEIGRSAKKEDALAGFERWKARHPAAAAHLTPTDLLVDAMRGRFTTWTRVRVNLQHVPPEQRPEQAELDPNDEPQEWVNAARRSRQKPSPTRKPS